MRRTLVLVVCLVLVAPLVPVPAHAAALRSYRSFETGRYRNLFADLGVGEGDLDTRIARTWAQFLDGGPDERLVHPGPGGTAYIVDLNHGDVRSEGLSYGMMIAVQLGDRPTLDALWGWAKRFLLQRSGPYKGLLAWQARPDGTRLAQNPAPDGDQWAAMALLFAANRWQGTPGAAAYGRDGQALLRALRARAFDTRRHQVVFTPVKGLDDFTDPSYHLPAFYELWARWATTADDRRFWQRAATVSRGMLARAGHPSTGLAPDYAHFDGSPVRGTHGQFGADAWRVGANVAMDHALFGADPRQEGQADRLLRFFAAEGVDRYGERYTLAGQRLSASPRPPALVAMNAAAGVAAAPELARPFVQALWDTPVPVGQGRYYDGLLYLLGLLYAGGRFRVHEPR